MLTARFWILVLCAGLSAAPMSHSQAAEGPATVTATEAKDRSVPYFHTCLSAIDDAPTGEKGECRTFSSRPFSVTPGQHTITGSFVTESEFGPIGVHAPLQASLSEGETYRLEGKRAGPSKFQLWLADAKGNAVSRIAEYFLPIVGTTAFLADSGTQPTPEKHRLFVIEQFDTSFARLRDAFRDRFRTLVQSCGVAVDFAESVPAAEPIDDLNRQVAAFAPDGILFINAKPGNVAESVYEPTLTVYEINAFLTDGQAKNRQWAAKIQQADVLEIGGPGIASGLVLRFSETGAFPHCPAIDPPRMPRRNRSTTASHCYRTFGHGASWMETQCN